MSTTLKEPSRRAKIADAEACQYVMELIYDRCGIRLHQGKEMLIQARLGKRIRQLGLGSLADYCNFLQTQGGDDEFVTVVDALTTNFTSFLREESHFQFLVETALPAVLTPGATKLRVWSAASSSGEEPYSIALYLAERFPVAEGWDWRITASDISTRVLETARKGVYPEDRVKNLPKEWLRRHFQKGIGPWSGHVRVKKNISERVDFSQINLIKTYTHSQQFHAVFCRNVMIYFDRPTQERLIQQLCRHLVPKGHLIIGHSESLNGLNVPLRCLRPSIYQLG